MKQEETSPRTAAQEPLAAQRLLKREVLPRAKAPQSKRVLRKRWLALLLLVFFLFGIIFIIPAGNIPGLRSLAAALGFSAEEMQQFSLARILATLGKEGFPSASERRARRGEGQQLLFDKYTLAGGRSGSAPQSGLLDWKALNASRAARGLPAEQVGRVYSVSNREDENRAAMNHAVTGWTQEAQQAINAASAQEGVLFGEDADVTARRVQEDTATNKGSADTFQLVQKAGVVGSVSSDWLGLVIDKAMLVSVGDLELNLQQATGNGNTPLINLNGALTASDKPRRDLARVWLLSKAANRAKQLMLKKQLASAGYMAMEMPKKVYDSFGGNSGLMMNGDEILTDFQETNKELLSEEQCRDLTHNVQSRLADIYNEAETVWKQSAPNSLPSCDTEEKLNNWTNQFDTFTSALADNCEKRKAMSEMLATKCDRKLKHIGECKAAGTRVAVYVTGYKQACNALLQLKQRIQMLQMQIDSNCPGNPNCTTWQTQLNAAEAEQVNKEKEIQTEYFAEDKKDDWLTNLDSSFGEGSGFFPEDDVKAMLSDW